MFVLIVRCAGDTEDPGMRVYSIRFETEDAAKIAADWLEHDAGSRGYIQTKIVLDEIAKDKRE